MDNKVSRREELTEKLKQIDMHDEAVQMMYKALLNANEEGKSFLTCLYELLEERLSEKTKVHKKI